ncbi:tol-pal system YbgF family protein [Sulfurovum sp.]|uniref:tetratricopeptide repeat protein n=1 Tax=Sulfurovum sp. TaxID=1969726 RepID=UPI0035623630
MYDIKRLEQEWKQYRQKKLRPWYIGSLTLLILIASVTIFSMNEKIDLSVWKSYFEASKEIPGNENKPIDMIVKQSVLVDNALDTLEVKESMINAIDKVIQKPPAILFDIPVLDDTNEPVQEDLHTGSKKMHLEIIESTSVTAYKDVEKRFLESHDIDDALFLARSYYTKGDYEKAEYWALEINKLDEDIEDGLLIFVKSKVKMGNENEAISILKNYVKKSDSLEAKKLLYQIENDKL